MRGWGIFLLVLAVGCGSGDEVAPDAGGARDAAVVVDSMPPEPDAMPPEPDAMPPACVAPVAPEPGAPCAADGECGAMGFCLDEGEDWSTAGYCTRVCAGDGDCGAGARCSNPIAGGERLCFRSCCAGDVCAAGGQACTDNVFGLLPLGIDACLPANTSATDGDACAVVGDCNVDSLCAGNPFETPGGYCLTLGCTVGDDSTCAPGGDGVCVDFDGAGEGPPACIDTCTQPSDCRESEGYTCQAVGPGLMVCVAPHADVGDACEVATDCGVAPWECLTGADYPGGYCGASGCDPSDEDSCPDSGFCYDPDGGVDGDEWCAAPCAIATDCRMGEGYDCIDLGGEMGCAVP